MGAYKYRCDGDRSAEVHTRDSETYKHKKLQPLARIGVMRCVHATLTNKLECD